MKNIITAAVFALATMPVAANATTVDFTVEAYDDSFNAGLGLGEATGITFQAGDTFSVYVDPSDVWVAHPPLPWGPTDANGYDQAGNAAPYSAPGSSFTAYVGALVGYIGGSYFTIGTGGSFTADAAGELKLFFWDMDVNGNSGDVVASVTYGSSLPAVPVPASGLLLAGALAALGVRRKLR